MNICALCGEAKQCRQLEIEGKLYDICSVCWSPLGKKLKGKGKVDRDREIVFSPPVIQAPQPKEERPLPGEPPKIWGNFEKVR
jgi:ribosome-binding protein aMBF1 (putative translation factor)